MLSHYQCHSRYIFLIFCTVIFLFLVGPVICLWYLVGVPSRWFFCSQWDADPVGRTEMSRRCCSPRSWTQTSSLPCTGQRCPAIPLAGVGGFDVSILYQE